MSVINAGLSGNQLTSSELPQLANTGAPSYLMGEAGQQRLAWDVRTQPGATDLIVHIGSNDLRTGVKAVTLIGALQQVVQNARKTYRRVFRTTILSGGYTREQAEQRQLVNNWILGDGNQRFDAVFDFATLLQAEDDIAMLNPKYDCGDGMHPNDDGYKLMAEAVHITKLSGSPNRET
jgi:lysophospholipase L1-like esterase